jgi:hypothetical protein
MSDARVLAFIERMESWIGDPDLVIEPELLAEWNRDFSEALATAERGPGWPQLVARAHALGDRVQGRAVVLSQERDLLRVELDAQAQGDRALKGYGASAR